MEWTDEITSVQRHLSRYVWTLRWCAGKRVLDVGCGIGYGTALIANVAQTVTGIDVSAEAFRKSRLIYPLYPNFSCCSIESFMSTSTYDVVVALEVLEHLDDMDAGLRKLMMMAEEAVLVSLPVLAGANPYHHGRNWSVEDCDTFMDRHAHGRIIEVCYQPATDTSNCEIRKRPIEDEGNVGYLQYAVWLGAM